MLLTVSEPSINSTWWLMVVIVISHRKLAYNPGRRKNQLKGVDFRHKFEPNLEVVTNYHEPSSRKMGIHYNCKFSHLVAAFLEFGICTRSISRDIFCMLQTKQLYDVYYIPIYIYLQTQIT